MGKAREGGGVAPETADEQACSVYVFCARSLTWGLIPFYPSAKLGILSKEPVTKAPDCFSREQVTLERNPMRSIVLAGLLLLLLSGCTSRASATPDDAGKFIDNVNDSKLRLGAPNNQARWLADNFITEDTQAIKARTNQAYIDAMASFAKEAVKFDKLAVPTDIRRELDLLKLSLTMATPSDPKEGEELAKLSASLQASYGKGKWCENPGKPDSCLDIDKITNTMAESFDEKRLRQVWEGWHTISPPMRRDFT